MEDGEEGDKYKRTYATSVEVRVDQLGELREGTNNVELVAVSDELRKPEQGMVLKDDRMHVGGVGGVGTDGARVSVAAKS